MTTLPHPYATLTAGRATLRFFHGDCLDLLPRLRAHSLDAVVTSPPYNLGVRYRSYDDSIPRTDYLEWTTRWIQAIARTLPPDGSLFLNVGSKPTDPWAALDVAQAARPYLHLQNTIHWVKSIVIDRDSAGASVQLQRDLAVGHYKPINSPRFLNDCHEFVFHFTPRGWTPLNRLAVGTTYQDASNIARWRAAAGGLRCRGNTWFIPYDTIQSRADDRPHPATFPPRLPELCFRLHGVDRVGLALDPFMGIGSTAIACARLELDFIGIEMDQDYLGEAVGRVQQALTEPGPDASSRRGRSSRRG